MTAKDTFDLDLSSFTLGFEDYSKNIIDKYKTNDLVGTIEWMVPIDIQKILYYRGLDYKGRYNTINVGSKALFFISNNFFAEKSKFLGFIQKVIDDYFYDSEAREYFIEKDIIEPLTSNIFNLDFYFDESDKKLKRKIDLITTSNINHVSQGLDDQNKDLYEQCVSEFLTFSLPSNGLNDFYHESLDRMKEIIENYLTLNYSGFRISKIKPLFDILFDGQNEEFKSILEYVVKKIHHNDSGNRIHLNQKEYIYIWLELNKILYLLKRYKS
jgi:hypothetical protein